MKLPWLFNIEPIWGLSDSNRFVEKISRASRDQKVVVWQVVWENYIGRLDKIKNLIDATRKVNPLVKIVLIADRWYQPDNENFLSLGFDETVFVDFFALATVSRAKKFNQEFGGAWSENRKKFLFLTGKPDKPNRIRLLWKFDQAGLLDRAIWSLFVPRDLQDSSRKFLPNISISQFQDFIENNTKSPDLVNDIPGLFRGSLHYCGFPFDVSMYNQSLFHVVSETHFSNQRPWITEKTWLALINRLPFIMAGDTNTLRYLQEVYGLRTFENHLPRSDYDKIAQPDARLDAIVENATYWLDNISTVSREINEDVEYNYHRMMSVVHENQLALDSFLKNNNLSSTWDEVIDDIDDINLEHRCFYTWYENIRDPSWPDCDNAHEWHDLPDRIKQECVEIFGYNPITKRS